MKWYTPSGKNLKGTSVNDSGINTFADNYINAMVREVIQNSLDAIPEYSDEKLIINFERKKQSISKLPGRNEFLSNYIPKAKKRWNHDSAAIEFLKKLNSNLNKDYFYILKVSDYNTTGLEAGQWSALVYDTGSSFKSNQEAGGSFGIGKAAPFAASDFRMIFYETLTNNKEFKSLGVTQFLSFDLEVNIYGNLETHSTEGPMYFGNHERDPYSFTLFDAFLPRTQVGTDLFIMGFPENNNWEDEILKSSLQNFIVSIYDGLVEVNVGEYKLNKESIQTYLNKYIEDKDLDITRTYYDVYTNPHSKKIKLSESFNKYGFQPDDAYFIFSPVEEATRKVLMTRKTGMKIYEKDRIHGSIQFNGIFRATGTDINRVLRSMENPRHDKWIQNLLKGQDLKDYGELLRDLRRFFRDVIIEEFGADDTEIIDAYGLDEFLPTIRDESQKKVTLGRNIKELVLTATRQSGRSVSEDETNKFVEKIEQFDFDEAGEVPRDDELTGFTANTGESLPPLKPNDKGSKEKTRKLKLVDNEHIVSRIIEINPSKGKYRLSFVSSSYIEYLAIDIHGTTEKDTLVKFIPIEATLERQDVFTENQIILNEVLINKQYQVDFQINYKQRIKLSGEFYES